MNRLTAVILAAVFALAAGGCGTRSVSGGGGALPTGSSTCTGRVTPDCTGYSYANPAPGAVVVTAPRSSGGNNREFFWDKSGRVDADATVCATFATGRGIDQQGIVLRLHDAPDAGITGITVTRNIWVGVFDVFNFHVWNTEKGPGSPFTQFGSTTISELPVTPAVYPLNMCARAVTTTDEVQFVVWTKGQSRPRWGNQIQGGEARMPAGAPSTGRGGWFAGHLVPGTSMTYRNLSVDGAVPVGLP